MIGEATNSQCTDGGGQFDVCVDGEVIWDARSVDEIVLVLKDAAFPVEMSRTEEESVDGGARRGDGARIAVSLSNYAALRCCCLVIERLPFHAESAAVLCDALSVIAQQQPMKAASSTATQSGGGGVGRSHPPNPFAVEAANRHIAPDTVVFALLDTLATLCAPSAPVKGFFARLHVLSNALRLLRRRRRSGELVFGAIVLIHVLTVHSDVNVEQLLRFTFDGELDMEPLADSRPVSRCGTAGDGGRPSSAWWSSSSRGAAVPRGQRPPSGRLGNSSQHAAIPSPRNDGVQVLIDVYRLAAQRCRKPVPTSSSSSLATNSNERQAGETTSSSTLDETLRLAKQVSAFAHKTLLNINISVKNALLSPSTDSDIAAAATTTNSGGIRVAVLDVITTKSSKPSCGSSQKQQPPASTVIGVRPFWDRYDFGPYGDSVEMDALKWDLTATTAASKQRSL